MNYLLDTCVLSEYTRRKPDGKVIRWVEGMDEEKLFLSAITIGEIHHGIERLPDSRRKTELITWINNGLIARFGLRVLSVDVQTMFLWGSLVARMENAGHPLALMDSLIVASALQHNLIIATRNVDDFLPCGIQVTNPWE
jgi:toxin FitB